MMLDLTEQEIRFLLQALGTQPFNQVAGLIGKIVSQAETQRAAPAGVGDDPQTRTD